MCIPLLAAPFAALGSALGGGAAAAAGAAASAGSGLAAIGTVASLVGTGVSVLGQLQAGKAAQAAAEYDAKVKTSMARDTIERGAIEEQEVRRRTATLKGTQKASIAAGGLDIGSGSALDIIGDTAALGELDALTTKNNAAREATALRSGAQLSRMEGKQARTASMFGAFGTALGGIGTVADKWYRMKSSTAGA